MQQTTLFYRKREYDWIAPQPEGVTVMLDVNPRVLRRLDVDTFCVRQIAREAGATRMVSCAPSVFTEARWTWQHIVFFDHSYRILPVVEYAMDEPHPRRHVVMELGWSEDIIDALRAECPSLRKDVSVIRAVIDMVTIRGERLPVINERLTGCN